MLDRLDNRTAEHVSPSIVDARRLHRRIDAAMVVVDHGLATFGAVSVFADVLLDVRNALAADDGSR